MSEVDAPLAPLTAQRTAQPHTEPHSSATFGSADDARHTYVEKGIGERGTAGRATAGGCTAMRGLRPCTSLSTPVVVSSSQSMRETSRRLARASSAERLSLLGCYSRVRAAYCRLQGKGEQRGRAGKHAVELVGLVVEVVGEHS